MKKKYLILSLIGAVSLGLATLLKNTENKPKLENLTSSTTEIESNYAIQQNSRFTTNPELALGPEDSQIAIVNPIIEFPLMNEINFLNRKEIFAGKVPYPSRPNYLTIGFDHELHGEIEVTCKGIDVPKYWKSQVAVYALRDMYSSKEYPLGFISLGDNETHKYKFDLQTAIYNLSEVRAIQITNIAQHDFGVDSVREIR